MARGISIHIGLNQVDPVAYDGWDGALAGCINDAQAMRRIADGLGYTSTVLLDADATAGRVVGAIGQAARELSGDDILLLTYSGHGGQIEDVNGDEADRLDETWVLYDRMLVDDELHALWAQFAPGARIVVISDSCHSGTIVRRRSYAEAQRIAANGSYRDAAAARYRFMPPDVANQAYVRQRSVYNALQWISGSRRDASLAARVLLISGCADNQLSADGAGNGLFTAKLLQVWSNGAFTGDYTRLHQEILALMPPEQSPNLAWAGVPDPTFAAQRPFSITSDGSAPISSARPAVQGPPTWPSSGGPPSLAITTGENPYYVIEIAARPELFDYAGHGHERTSAVFYASWADPAEEPRLTTLTYTMRPEVWGSLRQNARLYYRIGTTSSRLPGEWENYQVSSGDSQTAGVPFTTIVASSNGGGGAAGAPEPTLRRGDRGPAVARLQRLLVERGYSVTVDEIFGQRTDAAVRAFQRTQGLDADGVVGPLTWAALRA
jgi:metacaspase-1